ncbi:serine/threonine protein kinase [Coemansia sp. RSA 2675]|uniref:Serine/threonine protein kinase n=1 Tax=Coemansia linderi TaxID=2663919 RepID=A0ACC1KA56_9FUNG|nr:serine/threonine protein kinase [Coemansia sp. RSA 2675]KAJ2778181.1 serine/threonine protein kinase [Coemansia linderi]
MQSSRHHEVSPSHTLYDNNSGSTPALGMQGKKKFAHFRRLFSSLHKKSDRHNRNVSADSQASASAVASGARHPILGHDDRSAQKRLQQPPASSTVILRRPSSASSSSTASDENVPVISDRATGYILETYGLPMRTIGQGTGGYVKLHQACDGRYYAVKTFTFPDANDRTQMTSTGMNVRQWKHLLDEASFSLSLRHPNVIRTYQFVRENDGTVYSIMEYCEKDLFTVVQEGSLSQTDIDRLFFQLLSGVSYLHDVAHVAHRDMKLDNLCVDEEGNLKIIDFGCSSTFDPLVPALTRGICGSDPYISPEVFVPRAMYDPRKVDMWALGIIYLAMVSGHFPWEVAKPEDPNYALYLKYDGRVIDHWLPKTSPANSVIKSMLTIDPATRPTIDSVMREHWVAALAEQFGHSGTPLSKASTLAVPATEVKVSVDGTHVVAAGAVYGNASVGYASSSSTVSSSLSISSGY